MIICDIDGCIFANQHRAHLIPANKSRVENWADFNKASPGDMPVLPAIELVKSLHYATKQRLIFLTSRPESCRKETISQLFEHFGDIPNIGLYMRDDIDHRPPREFKKSVLDLLSDRFNGNSIVIEDNKDVMQTIKAAYPNLNALLLQSYDCTLAEAI